MRDSVPVRFNMARYCLGPSAQRPPEKVGLLVVHDAAAQRVDRWTFGALDSAVRACAAGLLDRGLRPGDRLLLRLGNTSEYPLLFFGAIAAGVLAVPTSSQLTAEEVAFVEEDSAAAAMALAPGLAVPTALPTISPEEVRGWVASVADGELGGYADTAADDPAFLVYTSGTSGTPKGVLHAQRSAWGRRPMYAGWYGLTSDDVMLHAGALNWTYTLGVGLTDPWAVGATACVYDGARSAGIWPGLIAATGATLFAAVPGVFRQILAAGVRPSDLAELRHGLTAGEALPPSLHAAWVAATDRPLYEALGMSEVSTFVSSSPSVPTRPGSPGRPQEGRHVAVLPVSAEPDPAREDPTVPDMIVPDPNGPLPSGAEGLLAVRRDDPGLMLGYWRRPDEDAAALRGDWFVSQDLVHLDADGYLIHHGRNDDVMTSMGYRVSPLEVEHVLEGARGVHEVAVTEVDRGDGVRLVTAFVVPEPAEPTGESAIIAYAHEHLAAYKCPRRVVFVDALPRTANGKIRRADLRGDQRFSAQP